jgi:branched-chain amino acid transport system substrate-binding protein
VIPKLTRRGLLVAGGALAASPRLRAQPAQTLRIGVLGDESGAYRDVGGPGSLACVRQAVKEFAASNPMPVEVLVADHQNKPDLAVSIARQWFDHGVDVLMDIQGSAIALAVGGLAKDRDKAMMACNVGSSDITGSACTRNTVHWAYDSYMMAYAVGTALVKNGGDTWFFIRADYAAGRSLENDATTFIKRAGGRVIGSVAMPFPSSDFSSAILQAQSSGAKVIGLANAGTDLINCIKQAAEFGVTRQGTKLAALNMFITNIHALGLDVCAGLVVANSFYWDLNDQTRAFTARVLPAMPNGDRPNMSQAACYSATLHYLNAAAGLGIAKAKASGSAVVDQMKATPVVDDVLGRASIRQDGQVISPTYLLEVKRPAESKAPWDYYKLLATNPADVAWRPLSEGGCSFIKT